jgi:plastocyanin
MPKKLSLIAVPFVALAVAACGNSASKTTPSAGSPPSSTSTTMSSSTSSSTSSTSSSTSTSAAKGAGATLKLSANPKGLLAFNTKSLTAKAGKVTIVFTNDSPLPHDVTVQKGTSGATIAATPIFDHGTKSITMTLAAGKYTYYCSVPGHRQAGMVGTLTVTG